MSILQALNQFNERYAPPAFGATPDVSDAQDQRWYDAGLDILDALLGSLRKQFKLGLATAPQRRSLLGRIVDEGRDLLRTITRPLTLGKIRLDTWFNRMKSGAMPRLYAGVMALLGPRDLPPIDRDALRLEVAKQFKLLANFRDEILPPNGGIPIVRLKTRDGLPNGQVESRAALYASAAWSMASNAERGAMVREGYKQERRILAADAQHCLTCPAQAALGWSPTGTLNPIGQSECQVNCRCFFEFR